MNSDDDDIVDDMVDDNDMEDDNDMYENNNMDDNMKNTMDGDDDNGQRQER